MKEKTSYPLLDPIPSNCLRSLGTAAATLLAAATSVVVGGIVDKLAAGGADVAAPLVAALALALSAAAATVALGECVPTWVGLRRGFAAAVRCARGLLFASQRAFERHDKGYHVNLLLY